MKSTDESDLGLEKARDVAHAVLGQVSLWSRLLGPMRDPYREGFRADLVSYFPKQPELTALRKACAAARTEIGEAIVEELAGLTVPTGVRAGSSYFASAHELSLSFANAVLDYLDVIEEPEYLGARGDDPKPLWETDLTYYLRLLWDIRSMAIVIAVRRVKMLADCETAIALRNRVLIGSALDRTRAEKSTTRRNMNPYSPSTLPSLLRLMRALSKAIWNGKLTALYREAQLRGQTQQRAVEAADLLGYWSEAREITPAGRAFLDEHAEVPDPRS